MLELIKVAFWIAEKPGSGRVELDMLPSCSRVIKGLGRVGSVIHVVKASVPKRNAIAT